jgi:hypothetical protein
MESVPVILPVVLGVKVTLIVQLAPDVRLPPQELLSPKLVVVAMPAMLSAVAP